MDEENRDIQLPVVVEPESSDLEESVIKQLTPAQQRFVHLYLSGQYKLADIAKLLNVATVTVRGWLGKPHIKALINEIQTEEDELVKQGIKALRMKALYKMSDLMDCKIDGIAYQAARDILDRTGHKAPAVSKQEVKVEVYTFEQQLKDVINLSDDADKFIDVDDDDLK